MEAAPRARPAHRSDDERVPPAPDPTDAAATHLPSHQVGETLSVHPDPIARQQSGPHLPELSPSSARINMPSTARRMSIGRGWSWSVVDWSVSFIPGAWVRTPPDRNSPLSEFGARRFGMTDTRVHLSPNAANAEGRSRRMRRDVNNVDPRYGPADGPCDSGAEMGGVFPNSAIRREVNKLTRDGPPLTNPFQLRHSERGERGAVRG